MNIKKNLLILLLISIFPSTTLAAISDSDLLAMASFTSEIALAIVFLSLITAWALNYSSAKIRVFGTLLAAIGCLAISGWFVFYILGTGFLENPKANQTPLDSAKPALLWSQASIALLAGLALFFAAFSQAKQTANRAIPVHNTTDQYGLVSRVLHWSIAILFLVLIPMGIFASIIPEDVEYRKQYYIVHKTLGVVVFILVLLRLVWNYKSPRPALGSELKPTERKLAKGAHVALYIMMLAIPLTGFIMTSFHGYPTFFFSWEIAPLWGPSEFGTVFWGVFHKYLLPYVLYIILGAHILGALKHQLIDKHQHALQRMVS